jgi:hypothetical protein
MDIELKTAEDLYEHYKNVRKRIEEASRAAVIKNGVIALPIKKLPPVEQHAVSEEAPVISLEPPKHLSEAQKIMYEVAVKHGIRLEDLRSPIRIKRFVLARHEAMWEIKRQRPGLSLPQIGRLFGNRDHTTVLHAIRKHQERLDAQKELCA